ncbi:MAG: sugar phosphate isomerase/epimerase [Planctomycetota bacterium]
MQLSLSGFLFEEDYKRQSLSFEDFAVLARQAGYTGVELRDTQINLNTSGNAVSQYRSVLDDNGLCVTCMIPRKMPLEDEERSDLFARYLDLAAKMGCRLLKVSGNPHWLRLATHKAAGYGIVVATGTHINSPTETVSGTKKLLEEVNHHNFGLLYDCMHLAIAAEDYLGAIDILYPHIYNVLVQCVHPTDKGENAVITYANTKYVKTRIDERPIQNWPAVFAKLKHLGYNGLITVIENTWPIEKRKDIAFVYAKYIKELWCKL